MTHVERPYTPPAYNIPRPAEVLLADPPWRFKDNLPGKGRGAAKHYETLSLPEILRFPLPPLADDAWLFLWRVSALQEEAHQVIRAWDFKPSQVEFVWVKTKSGPGREVRSGMGWTLRNSHEVCLIAKRGRPDRYSKSLPTVIHAPRPDNQHSAKPEASYLLIEQLTGIGRRPVCAVELFARRERENWYTFGNQVAKAA